MVQENLGFPDPGTTSDREEITGSPANTIPVQNIDSDTEDEENIYNGYEPLPTNDLGLNDADTDDSSSPTEAVEQNVPPTSDLPAIIPIESDLVREVWNAPPPKEVDIEMDANRVEEVKLVMQNVVLPSSSIPEWAASIPEDELKQQLLDRIKNLKH